MKDIEMIATFDTKGIPHPFRFRLAAEDESLLVVKIEKILYMNENKRDNIIKYRCICIINDIKRTVDIYFKKFEMKWYLDM